MTAGVAIGARCMTALRTICHGGSDPMQRSTTARQRRCQLLVPAAAPAGPLAVALPEVRLAKRTAGPTAAAAAPTPPMKNDKRDGESRMSEALSAPRYDMRREYITLPDVLAFSLAACTLAASLSG